MTTFSTPSDGIGGLAALAQIYFDAAYDMDADKFASIFHEASTVTRLGENDSVVVTPINTWLDTVRAMNSPRQAGVERQDRIVSINLARNMALLQLRLRIPPREVTDLLSCFFINGQWRITQKVFEAEPLP